MTEKTLPTASADRTTRHRGLLLAEAAVAIVLALVATVWVYADPYIDLETRAILPRIAVGAVLSVGLSGVLMARGGRTARGIGWAVIALRVPVSLHLLWFLLPQITSELL
ncbi:hypothetical protein AB0M32_12350 [Streptomyces sp. NPDC051985]|uniref:hypothetical protein n=1 Tax=Streptomyces sp. NPDC051985 TaxID=3155807 RepID=UPI00343E9C89